MASPESDDKGAESVADKVEPIGRFRGLLRGVLKVQPSEMKEAERRYKEEKEAARPSARDPTPHI